MTFTLFCKQFTEDEVPFVQIGRRYFYDPKGLKDVAVEHKWDAFSVGLYLGEERKGFTPSSALIDLLASRIKRRVVVGEKAAWMFLCGKDVLMEGVARAGEFVPGEIAIVADRDGNVLGYGDVCCAYLLKAPHKVYLKHRHDRGEYLRRERR